MTDVKKLYENKKHFFPVKAEKGCKKGELRIRLIEDSELQIYFVRTDETWENLEEWYDSRIKGENVVIVNKEENNPTFINDETVEVKQEEGEASE